MKVFASIIAGLGAIAALVGTENSSVRYTAHEWGTFTSVQGSDGVQMAWNPFSAAELPKFVIDASREQAIGLLLTKSDFNTRQRLETPVIYFHADAPFTVDVNVGFPEGRVTEWYPSATVPLRTKKGPAIIWPKVTVIPRSNSQTEELESKLPNGEAASHYYAAREAEADLVRVTGKDGRRETEKFLFYRGVGGFAAPLQVTMPNPAQAELRLENTGSETLRSLVVVRVGEGLMTVTPLGDLQAKSSTVATIGSPVPIDEGRKQLATSMREAVARAGLTASEAAAMVKTWDESWFTERGVRVLYVLPRGWADSVLPLTLKPAPQQLERVFVGRAEVITPVMEKSLAAEVERGRSADEEVRADAVKNIRALGLGRFLGPAFQRVETQHKEDAEFRKVGWELVQAANQSELKISQR